MTKARTLANFISDGSTLADGAISVSEVSGAASLASPTFTGLVSVGSGDSGVTPYGDLFVEDDGNAKLAIASPNTHSGFLDFGDPESSSAGRLEFNHPTDAFYFSTQGTSRLKLAGNVAVFNDAGADTDFRVESDSNTHMFFVDASTNRVSIGTANNTRVFNVHSQTADSYMHFTNPNNTANGGDIGLYDNGTNAPAMLIINREAGGSIALSDNTNTFFDADSSEITINENGGNIDFRVESDNNTHFLFVDAANGHFGVNNSTPEVTADIQRNSSTGFSNTGDQRGQMALTIRNGSEASGRFVGMNLIAGGGAQSDWSINNVWQSNYVGKLAFKTRTGGGSSDWRQILAMTAGNEVVFNEDSTNIDFRVESNNNANMFFVDAGNDVVNINATGTDKRLRVDSGNIPVAFFNYVDYSDVSNVQIYHARAGQSGNTATMIQFLNTNASEVGAIKSGLTGTNYNTSSDYRLKENVVYDWDATTRLKQLKPARFNFIVDADTTVDGFLAHEAQAVVPECATGTHNEVDDNGDAVMQGIDQSKLVPLLVKTIQELEARITALENA